MENNQLIEKYRRESYILEYNRNRSDLNPTVIEGNKSNLEGHLLQLKGNENGIYFDGQFKERPSTLTILQEKQKELAKKFEKHCLEQLKIGNPRPKRMPAQMQEEKDKLDARLSVAEEEISWLEKKLQEAQEQEKKSRGSLLTHPKDWGSGELRDGQLVQIGPWKVEPDPEGLLCIEDPDSPYNTMPVWRFRAEVTNPMGMEFTLRHKNEETAAVAEGRPKKPVKYPEPPHYDSKHDNIEYPGDYDPSIIRKLKQSVE